DANSAIRKCDESLQASSAEHVIAPVPTQVPAMPNSATRPWLGCCGAFSAKLSPATASIPSIVPNTSSVARHKVSVTRDSFSRSIVGALIRFSLSGGSEANRRQLFLDLFRRKRLAHVPARAQVSGLHHL